MDPQGEFRLGEWQVTPLRGVLHGPMGTRRLTPKAMDLLLCLVRHHGDVVERDALLQEVWSGRVFSDDPLNKVIAELRRQLGDNSSAPAYIETIPKRGYRLVADYEPIGQTADERTESGSHHRKHWYRAIAATALLVLLAVVLLQYFRAEDPAKAGAASIAVLPFELLSSAESREYFADGIHEEVITALSRNSNLDVRSRTTTLKYRDHTMSVPEIAMELQVDLILEGTVRQENDAVRVTAQLLDGESDTHVWSAIYEEELSVAELFAIQNRMATEISAALALTLAPTATSESGRLPTDNLAAYDQFMLGKYHYRRQLPGDLEKSVASLQAAVELDPQFADAWDWLAYAYNHAATQVGYLTPAEAYPKARAAALRALEIEPDLATAVAILGYIRAVFDWDWIGAERDMRRALELDHDDSGTVWSLAHVLSMLGRHDEAIRLASEFAEQRPTIGRRHLEVANRLIDAARFNDALVWLKRAADNGAEPAQVEEVTGLALFGRGDIDAAIDKLRNAVDGKRRATSTVALLAHVLAVNGDDDEARSLLREIEQRSATEPVSAITLATVHTGLRDDGRALELLEQAARERDRAILNIANDVCFTRLRANARFAAIVASFRIPD